jgi:N-succinyldiaminopimelate aminotransferase
VAALHAPTSFYDQMRAGYRSKRDLLAAGLETAGFDVHRPDGTYFLMAGYPGNEDDRAFCRRLAEQARVVAIPPSVFYSRPGVGSNLVRFAFCKDDSTLQVAIDRIGAFV